MLKNKPSVISIILLPVAAGLLLYLPWLKPSGYWFLFIAFMPVLYVLEIARKTIKNPIFRCLYVYIPFLIWNLDNGWIYSINKTGGVLAIIVNAFLISWPWMVYVFVKFKSLILSRVFLICSVLSMEIIHHKGQLAFPFHTIGNGFAVAPKIIQWYETTGVYGGSLWVLLVNILIFRAIEESKNISLKLLLIRKALPILLIILLPIISSLIRFKNYKESNDKIEVVAIHPRTDVHTHKYQLNNSELVDEYLEIARQYISDSTRYLIFPETAIPHTIHIDSLNSSPAIIQLRNFLKNYPNCQLVTGIVLGDSPYHKSNDSTLYTEYNAAIQLSYPGMVNIKSKHQCVPFTEVVPYPAITMPLKKRIPALAGYNFSKSNEYGFKTFTEDNIQVVPIICFESAFCNLYNPNFKRAKTFFAVILNEGWYNDIRVATHFLNFSILRSVEYRKSIVRSSNMGISGIVNSRGEISNLLSLYGKKGIRAQLEINTKTTIFQRLRKHYEFIIIGIFIFLCLFQLQSFLVARYKS